MSMMMLSGMLYNLYMVSSKYFNYPVAVGITIEHATDLEFPAVTICNMSPVKASVYNTNQTSASNGFAGRRRRRRDTCKYDNLQSIRCNDKLRHWVCTVCVPHCLSKFAKRIRFLLRLRLKSVSLLAFLYLLTTAGRYAASHVL